MKSALVTIRATTPVDGLEDNAGGLGPSKGFGGVRVVRVNEAADGFYSRRPLKREQEEEGGSGSE